MATQIIRSPIEQTFFNFALAVGTTPTPVSSQIQIASLISSIIFSNPSTNANSVFLGDQNVSTTSGIEIVVGASPVLSIQQTRQLYEVQDPSLFTAQVAMCAPLTPISIPVIVWNPLTMYFVASAPTTIGVMMFRNVYT